MADVTFCIFIPQCSYELLFSPTAVPDPPEDPEVLSKTKQSITLSWFTPLHDGGSPILGYRVEFRLVDSSLWLPCQPEPVCNTEFLVENLIPGSGYRFRVAAINIAGTGDSVELPQTVQLGEWMCCSVHLEVTFLMRTKTFALLLLKWLNYYIMCLFSLCYTEAPTPPPTIPGKTMYLLCRFIIFILQYIILLLYCS